MEARREARRRRILENADNRLKRVMEVQSKARKKAIDDETTERNDVDYLRQSLTPARDKEETHVCTNNDIKVKDSEDSCEMTTTEDNRSMHENRGGSDDLTFEQKTPTTDSDDEIIGTNGFQSDAKMQKCIERRQMIFRMVIILGLAILLVVVSNLKTIENTRYGEIRKSSFLPYFITLEFILLCLFPVERGLETASVINILLTIIGFNEKKIWIIYIVDLATRLFQDFIWFTFTITILNHYTAKS